ncbi:MAG: HIT family protein [Candidatus Aenigmatarchaeota archaeon]
MSKRCPHCPGGFGLKYPLFHDDYFWIVCDAHPLTEGHILVIPKAHVPCMAALDNNAFVKFRELYENVSNFLNRAYGRTAVFEHGIAGQSVFHAHTHFLPFGGSINEIIPEKLAKRISDLGELKTEFNKEHEYLYFAIGDNKHLVDTRIAYPRFFRERFAESLGVEERGNWKRTESNAELMRAFETEIRQLKNKWSGK